jgi:GNAT superfamily N-acetyltransferase
MVKVELLADHLELVPVIAGWHWDKWGNHDPQGSLDKWTVGLASRTQRDRIPMTFVAFDDDQPVGSAVLVEYDMEIRRDLTPWLAGVYVQPDFRSRGVASRLVEAAMNAAQELGVETLYLYTRSAVGLYQRLGWKELDRIEYQGREVTIMYAQLGA